MHLKKGQMDVLPEVVRLKVNRQERTSLRRPDLEAILHSARYDAGMREGVRSYLRAFALTLAQEENRPLTGAYYWVPLPDRSRKESSGRCRRSSTSGGRRRTTCTSGSTSKIHCRTIGNGHF